MASMTDDREIIFLYSVQIFIDLDVSMMKCFSDMKTDALNHNKIRGWGWNGLKNI